MANKPSNYLYWAGVGLTILQSIVSISLSIYNDVRDLSPTEAVIFQNSIEILENLIIGKNLIVTGNLIVDGIAIAEDIADLNGTLFQGAVGPPGPPGPRVFFFSFFFFLFNFQRVHKALQV